MANPYSELSAAIVADLVANSIPAVRTRMHRLTNTTFEAAFGDNPGVVVSKVRVVRNLEGVSRIDRRATITVSVAILGTAAGRDATDPTEEDAFDDYVNAVDAVLDGNYDLPTYGEATWVESSEIDDNELTRTIGDFQTALEITYFIDSDEV